VAVGGHCDGGLQRLGVMPDCGTSPTAPPRFNNVDGNGNAYAEETGAEIVVDN
jgi:hypothetical protein